MPENRKTAFITGASSGIGKALAYEFAKKGFDLLLTARDAAALEKIADECKTQFNVCAEVLPADLADEDSIDELTQIVSKKTVDILVNNAGFGVKGDFAETSLGEELKMLDVQLAALLKLTKAVLPQMLARRSGKILNVASVYAFAPVPKQAVYSASKAFILNFSSALQNEVREAGIGVAVLCPGITQTEFRVRAGIADKKNSGMTAQAVAEIAVRELLGGRHIIIPGFQNKVFARLAGLIPSEYFSSIVRLINNRRGVNKNS